MKFNKHQCRACGKDHSKQSKDWRRKNNCRPWPTPDPAHLPKRSWKAPNAGMICGDCRQIKHKVTRVATSLQKKSSKQTAKLREQSKKLSKTKVTLKVVREQVKKLEHVSARKPETTSDFAAFCKEKRVSATELRVFRKVRLWLSKRRKAGASVKDVVEPLLDILNNGRLPCDHIFYEYIRRCAVNLNRKHIAAARWGRRIMDLIAAAQCIRGGKPVLASLRGTAGAGEGRFAPLEKIIGTINFPARELPSRAAPPPPPLRALYAGTDMFLKLFESTSITAHCSVHMPKHPKRGGGPI